MDTGIANAMEAMKNVWCVNYVSSENNLEVYTKALHNDI